MEWLKEAIENNIVLRLALKEMAKRKDDKNIIETTRKILDKELHEVFTNAQITEILKIVEEI